MNKETWKERVLNKQIESLLNVALPHEISCVWKSWEPNNSIEGSIKDKKSRYRPRLNHVMMQVTQDVNERIYRRGDELKQTVDRNQPAFQLMPLSLMHPD